jgi:hypothetical protein
MVEDHEEDLVGERIEEAMYVVAYGRRHKWVVLFPPYAGGQSPWNSLEGFRGLSGKDECQESAIFKSFYTSEAR